VRACMYVCVCACVRMRVCVSLLIAEEMQKRLVQN